ncbi:mechanosensitive ion channel family protein [Aerococcus sanguinicola]|nr:MULTISPECIES: mechanosensitive ion channel family protein [Aerococcus]AMB93539.1 hypothetical protein AWM72_01640 [Aerococcus sanguinicola]MDK7050757.1 mechanosensitive ion channel family protein [Aerococcus sanguinicola]OFT97520.1 hypothetical protein HMPREF3090_00775 [Aerococcus sp. HMSC23C02]
MNHFLEYLNSDQLDSELFIEKALYSLAAILLTFFLMKGLKWLLPKLTDNENLAQRINRFSRLIVFFLAFIFILSLWFSQAKLLGVIILIILAFLTLASRDVVVDLVAYLYIILRSPLEVGSVIDINGVSGEVVDLDFLQINLAEVGTMTKARTHTGRYISVPNRWIFEHAIYNYNHDSPYVVVDVMVPIDYGQDLEKVKKITAKVAYEKYEGFLEQCTEEELKLFKRKMDGLEASTKPQIRIEYGNRSMNVYIQFFTPYDKIAVNKMIMQNALYFDLRNRGIQVTSMQVVKFEE